MPKLRVVVDLNVYISAALAIKAGRLDSPALAVLNELRADWCEGLICAEMFYELADRLHYPRFGFEADFILEFIDIVAGLCTVIPVRALDIGGRDDEDDKVVQTAIDGRAAVIVAHDKDILEDPAYAHELDKRSCARRTVEEFLEDLRSGTDAHPSPPVR